jgi:DNA-binding NarL/FixJ family response regulator
VARQTSLHRHVSILLVGGRESTRNALASAFARDSRFKLHGSVAGPADALDASTILRPAIVLFDPQGMAEPQQLARRIRLCSPDSALVVHTSLFGPDEKAAYLRLGAAACLFKGESFERLTETLLGLVAPNLGQP